MIVQPANTTDLDDRSAEAEAVAEVVSRTRPGYRAESEATH